MNVNLGERMKAYEAAATTTLPPRMPMLIRVDGRAFRTYTRKNFKKPWDVTIRDGFSKIAAALLREIPGAKVVYCQSDECTVLVTDYDSRQSQPWFGKVAAKINSVAASIATAAFIRHMANARPSVTALATFDARCFVLPQQDVCNAFIWRQKDAERNSILGYAQSNFGHKAIHGLKCDALRDRLEANKTPWEECATWEKRGWCVVRKTTTMSAREWSETWHHPMPTDADEQVTRAMIVNDYEIPIFTQDRGYIERHVYLDDEAQA